MDVLITGTDGLVGFNIWKSLSENTDYKLFSTSRQNKNNIQENHILCDLESDALKIRDINCIIHCAAVFPKSFSADDSIICAKTNRAIDDNILNLAKINNSKVVFISSVSVYKNFGETLKETSELCDNNPYAIEKINTESILLGDTNLKSFILRIPSPYGLKQKNNSVLKIFVDRVKCKSDVTYFGQGKRLQNFINATDIARAVKACIESDETGVYNIASGKNINMKDLADTICSVGKKVLNSTSSPISAEGTDEYNHLDIDISKSCDLLGWQPIIHIEDGICEMLEEKT